MWNEANGYVTRAEAARRLNVHPKTIDRFGSGGKLQRYMRRGHIVYSIEELEEMDKAVPWSPVPAESDTTKRDWLV